MYVPAWVVERQIAEGSLRRVLEDWTHHDPGFHIYYSSFRQVPVGLRLLIDLIRELEPLGPLP
jgi:DNA-binding transcriptional LysR family regulator